MNAELRALNAARAERRRQQQEEEAARQAAAPPAPPEPNAAALALARHQAEQQRRAAPQRLGSGEAEDASSSPGASALRALHDARQERQREEASAPKAAAATKGAEAAEEEAVQMGALRFARAGASLEISKLGRSVTRAGSGSSQAYVLTNALRAGKTTACFRLDYTPDAASDTIGVYPADWPLDGTGGDKGSACTLVIGGGLGGWAQVTCAGQESTSHKALHCAPPRAHPAPARAHTSAQSVTSCT